MVIGGGPSGVATALGDGAGVDGAAGAVVGDGCGVASLDPPHAANSSTATVTVARAINGRASSL
jgi:hypothetical protein